MLIQARWSLGIAGALVLLIVAALLAFNQSGRSPHGPLPALRRPRVVIRKSAHRLTVYDGDRRVRSYRAAVGSGRGDKAREGDRRTPEGEFVICVKNPRSRFKRALGLSYPNVEDAARGLRDGLITSQQHDAIVAAIRQGKRPPWDTALGGEIMIHGGGAGSDWTIGCVALEDEDVLEVYRALPVGTPVKILP